MSEQKMLVIIGLFCSTVVLRQSFRLFTM